MIAPARSRWLRRFGAAPAHRPSRLAALAAVSVLLVGTLGAPVGLAAAPVVTPAGTSLADPSLVPDSLARTDQILVRWPTPQSAAEAGSVAHLVTLGKAVGHGLRFVRLTASGAAIYRLDVRLGRGAKQLLTALRGAPGVTSVEPDLWMTPSVLPNDPYAAQLWGLLGAANGSPYGVDVVTAWNTSQGAGVVVAVVDTGLVSHPDLAGQALAGYDMVNDSTISHDGDGRDADATDPGDWCGDTGHSSWHGTHVAGTIAALANNSLGVFGGAPAVKIEPVRVLGACGGYSTDVADGIRWAAGGTVSGVPTNPTPAKVLNLSLGGASPSCPTEYAGAIADARSRGAVVVIAAGNSGADAAGFAPANCPGALTVAAIDSNGLKAAFSNYGSLVALAGPGVGVWSTIDAGVTTATGPTYASYSGTSMATPHVVLSAALVRAAYPGLSPDGVETVLEATALPLAADPASTGCALGCGAGAVNAGAALTGLAGGSPLVAKVTSSTPYPISGTTFALRAYAVDRTGVASASWRWDAGSWQIMSAADGAFGGAGEALSATILVSGSEGPHQLCVRASDGSGHISAGTSCVGVLVDAGPPSISTPVLSLTSTNGGNPVAVSATAADGTSVAGALMSIDGGPAITMRATDGAFGGLSEAVGDHLNSAVLSVASGAFHSCALLIGGTVECWGYDRFNQLGDGSTASQAAPVEVPGLSGVIQIAVGGYHDCALLTDHTVRCWGLNNHNQLGDGSFTNQPAPVTVTGLSAVTSLALGYNHSCALLADGTVRCWGDNTYGQGSNGNLTPGTNLVTVPLSGVQAITTGDFHTCALLLDATARCWGYNYFGQLGDGTTTNSAVPVAASSLTGLLAIAAGGYHDCVLLADHTVRCWGYDDYGQLGAGTFVNHSLIPVTVSGLTNVAALNLGGFDSCARLADDTARCWGEGFYGQLGNGGWTSQALPVAVSGLTGVSHLAPGYFATCAALRDTTVRCWGYNGDGELGDGTGVSRAAPVTTIGIGALPDGSHRVCVIALDGIGQATLVPACTSFTIAAPVATPTLAYTGTASATPGALINLTSVLKNSAGQTLSGKIVRFGLNGATLVATTNSSGVAKVSTSAPTSPGTYPVVASFAGDGTNGAASVSSSLVVKFSTRLSASVPNSVAIGATFSLSLTLKTGSGSALAGQTLSVTFAGHGTTVTTNSSGAATLNLVAPTSLGTYGLLIAYAGTTSYRALSKSLSVAVKTPTKLTYGGPTSASRGATITLSATLTSSGGSVLAGRSIRFSLAGHNWNATTNSLGVASVKISAPTTAATYTLGVAFSGDSTDLACSTATSLKVG